MRIDIDKCKGCGLCEEVCPLGVAKVEKKKAKIEDGCVDCKSCLKVCPVLPVLLCVRFLKDSLGLV